jgi:hypothetical protein
MEKTINMSNLDNTNKHTFRSEAEILNEQQSLLDEYIHKFDRLNETKSQKSSIDFLRAYCKLMLEHRTKESLLFEELYYSRKHYKSKI